MNTSEPFPVGTPVTLDIDHLVTGTGIIAAVEDAEGWLYRVDRIRLFTGDAALLSDLADTEADGSAWLCEHEVTPIENGELP